MDKTEDKKTKYIVLIVAILILIIVGIFLCINNKETDVEDNEIQDEEIGLTGLIDNEQYYYDKQQEYYKVSEEYEDLTTKYVDESFTDEQKSIINDYNEKLNNESDNDKLQQLGEEYSKLYEQYIEQQFTEEQKKVLEEKKRQMDELEKIVIEYQDLIEKAQEEKDKSEQEVLEDGKISIRRSDVVEDKEYNGIKYTNIQLIYDPVKKETVLSMKAENITDETKGNEMITLNFTGRTECKYPLKIEEIPTKEYLEIELPIDADLRDSDKLEIIKFEESDYKQAER